MSLITLKASDYNVKMTEQAEQARDKMLSQNRFLRSFLNHNPVSDYFNLNDRETRAIVIEHMELAGDLYYEHLGIETMLFALKYFAIVSPKQQLDAQTLEAHRDIQNNASIYYILEQILEHNMTDYYTFLRKENRISDEDLEELVDFQKRVSADAQKGVAA